MAAEYRATVDHPISIDVAGSQHAEYKNGQPSTRFDRSRYPKLGYQVVDMRPKTSMEIEGGG